MMRDFEPRERALFFGAQKRLRERSMVNDQGCWEWTGTRASRNYGGIWFDGKMRQTHRVSAFLSGVLSDLSLSEVVVRHKCNNSICCNPDHLCVGSHQDNYDDIRKSGKQKGVNNPASKLNDDQVREIRDRLVTYRWGDKKKLANEYSVSTNVISRIASRKLWAHVEDYDA